MTQGVYMAVSVEDGVIDAEAFASEALAEKALLADLTRRLGLDPEEITSLDDDALVEEAGLVGIDYKVEYSLVVASL